METIYRVEHEDGWGPYRSRSITSGIDDLSGYDWGGISDRHPSPQGNLLPIGLREGAARFGFKALSHLKRWFNNKERKLLKKLGFKVKCYKVPSRYLDYDDHQAVFHKDHASVVGELDLLAV